MATEKRKIHRVIDAAGNLVQVLPETSAEQVTLADTAGNFTSNNVEGALAEVAEIAKAGGVTGVKCDAETDYRKGNVNITKANIGLGNVDNTADANKSVKHATSADSATTAASATTANSATKATQDASGNVITTTYATKNELRDGLAGKANTKTYENYQAFVTAMGLLPKSELKVGDNIYIKKLDVPDMWVTAVNATSASYTYTNDQAIINALDTTNGLTVGYFSFSKLETEKVDLSTYQTKTDNTLETTSKTVVGAINEVKGTAGSALSKANANATEISNLKDGTTKVKKAETADNATNVTTSINGKEITDIFETNSTTVKNATKATNANYATSAGKVSSALKIKVVDMVSGGIRTLSYDGSSEREYDLDTTDFQTTAGTANSPTPISLRPTGVTAGKYSAVNVDTKGRVTAGGKSIEWGTSGQTTPSGDLMTGGLFMELQ
jgi:hypothetical protein